MIHFGMVTTEDSGIKKVEDVKGKRVAFIPGGITLNLILEAPLWGSKLTWDDVKKVEYASYTKGLSGLAEGKVDVCSALFTAPAFVEVESSPHGAYIIPVPPPDKEPDRWKRIHEKAPYVRSVQVIGEPGARKTPVYTTGYPNCLSTYPWVSENIIWGVCKGMVEGYKSFKDVNADAARWTLDACLKPVTTPYHPGTVRCLREIGKWTPELQAHQEKMLAEEEARIKSWQEKKK